MVPLWLKIATSLGYWITIAITDYIANNSILGRSFALLYTVPMIFLQSIASYFGTKAIYEEFIHNREEEYKVELVAVEQGKSHQLIRCILPEKVIARLKIDPKSVHDNIIDGSVCFVMVNGFQEMLTENSDVALEILCEIFEKMDDLVDEHHCQKIKSTNNIYLVVSGIFGEEDHFKNIANFALATRSVAEDVLCKNDKEATRMSVNIGFSAGPFSAGVLGKTKFLYDVFGDTVNVASRICMLSEPGKIQMCGRHCVELFEEYNVERRGYIKPKGKSELETYWLLGKR